jgi:rare lipoprotein A
MTARQRIFTLVGLGLIFLGTPVPASLEKIVLRPHARAYVATAKKKIIASWYGQEFQGMMTSSGELFDLNKMTAAHRTLPLGSRVKLNAVSTGKSVIVRINDRGPWVKGRDFDISEAAAIALGIHNKGIAEIEATLAGDDHAAKNKTPRL